MQRVFVVGCPRSGTTIIQAMLARHSGVYTLPETAFFVELLAGLRWRWGDPGAIRRGERLAHRLGFARHRGRRAIHQLQRQLQAPAGWPPVSRASCIRRFVATLDRAAEAAGRHTWIEKTPHHLLYIPEIQAHVPDARFVHVVRPGPDVLASVTHANMRFADNRAFGGDMQQWIGRWNRAMEIHHRYLGQPAHHVVMLEDLVAEPERHWRQLGDFLGLPGPLPDGAPGDQYIADLRREPWKHKALNGQPQRQQSMVAQLFGPQLQQWLSQQMVSYDTLQQRCRAQQSARIQLG